MKTKQSRIASETPLRTTRARPTPQWLLTSTELDQIAQRRCVKLLSVLSGETSVTDAIAEMQVSRGTYYQLENKALAAMLAALTPGVESASSADGTLTGQLRAMEEKVKKLEQGKRRAERLLLLTRRVVKPGPSKVKAGRPPGSRNGVRKTRTRRPGSPSSTPTPPCVSSEPSIPTRAGESGPRGGTAS
ncbi:MAG TPA: hypothetical protein VLX28_04920 [Thermoanaerobaculia bacterium]|nr:hypothetical protein [Thermoanaerobaculia bacterium]